MQRRCREQSATAASATRSSRRRISNLLSHDETAAGPEFQKLVDTADVTISTLQQQIEQTENQITLLLGENPAGIARRGSFDENTLPPDVPVGLPPALLERRPDIRAAEQNLTAANADIGVAKAAYFPRLSLSGLLGGQSAQLSSLFNGPNSAWSFVPQLSQPIFAAGRLGSRTSSSPLVFVPSRVQRARSF
jgi:outer membrane protein TolC